MTNAHQTHRFTHRLPAYRQLPEDAGWRPEYGAALGALKRYQQPRGGPALDYGCGLGDLTATLGRTGYRAVGVDTDYSLVHAAQSRHPHLTFVALDAGPVTPFGGEHFWALTAINTIQHTTQPARVLAEFHRLLAPGGLLVMTLPNLLSPLRPLKRFLVRRRQARYGPESGEDASQALALLMRNMALLLDGRIVRQPRFQPRRPDFQNAERYRLLGYGADYDAVWLCNPWDIAHRLQGLGMSILEQRGIPGLAQDSAAISRLRGALPAAITSPVLLVARRTF